MCVCVCVCVCKECCCLRLRHYKRFVRGLFTTCVDGSGACVVVVVVGHVCICVCGGGAGGGDGVLMVVSCPVSPVSCLVSCVSCLLFPGAPGRSWRHLAASGALGRSWWLLGAARGSWRVLVAVLCVCMCVCGGGGGRILEKWVLRCMVSFLKHPVRFPRPVSAHRTRPRPPDTALCVSGARAWYCVRFRPGKRGQVTS